MNHCRTIGLLCVCIRIIQTHVYTLSIRDLYSRRRAGSGSRAAQEFPGTTHSSIASLYNIGVRERERGERGAKPARVVRAIGAPRVSRAPRSRTVVALSSSLCINTYIYYIHIDTQCVKLICIPYVLQRFCILALRQKRIALSL